MKRKGKSVIQAEMKERPLLCHRPKLYDNVICLKAGLKIG